MPSSIAVKKRRGPQNCRPHNDFITGGATGTRTLDLIHAIFGFARDADRFTEVDRALAVRGKLWKLGVVAVKIGRQTERRYPP